MSTRLQSTARLVMATLGLAVIALAAAAARPAEAAGLRNCTEITDSRFAQSGCWEDVWSGGSEYRVTFATGCCVAFKGSVPEDLDKFYVMAPQDDTPQSLNAAFRHDHVVRSIPRQPGYNPRLRGVFVLCSEEGITSGACVFEMNSPQPGVALPFARTANGQALTSVETIEAAADAGDIFLLDTGAVIVGSINQNR